MAYSSIRIIRPQVKDELIRRIPYFRYERKAEIHGMCIELLTDNSEFKEMWEDNFSPMMDSIRPHGRLLVLSDPKLKENSVFYEPVSKTVFLYNCGYYGYVKSLALSVASDFIEDYQSIHERGAVHGACIDFLGKGVAIIAPSGTGKTTLSYGLLTSPMAKLVADDWFYVKITNVDAVAYMSEKNSYIGADLSKNWEVFKKLVKDTHFDPNKRGVANVENVLGADKLKYTTVLEHLFILKRDHADKASFRTLDAGEALRYLVRNGFCNPHYLVRDARKSRLRKLFFKTLLERVDVHMVNTIRSPAESLNEIKDVLGYKGI